MSEQTTTEATATDAEGTEQTQPKPTETVDFWKQKAREQEGRAKANAEAARRLAEIEESQKSEAEKVADRIAKAEAEVATVPAKVAASLRDALVSLGVVSEDRKVLLTATEPEALLEQVKAIQSLTSELKTKSNHVPREGENPKPGDGDPMREFTRDLFARAATD
jgi:TPR repeat protein